MGRGRDWRGKEWGSEEKLVGGRGDGENNGESRGSGGRGAIGRV